MSLRDTTAVALHAVRLRIGAGTLAPISPAISAAA